uniref:Uncharacterized protein n=1 Tax=Rhizobium phage LG08 TaxID=3129229 RepID=A0AAU8HY04_9CAUD
MHIETLRALLKVPNELKSYINPVLKGLGRVQLNLSDEIISAEIYGDEFFYTVDFAKKEVGTYALRGSYNIKLELVLDGREINAKLWARKNALSQAVDQYDRLYKQITRLETEVKEVEIEMGLLPF